MKGIEIDLETYKLIESQRLLFEESSNDIIKRIFRQWSSSVSYRTRPQSNTSSKDLITRNGEVLPHGLQLRRLFKGEMHEAVVEDGAIQMDGERYLSPSDAAFAVTHNNRNGWEFWEYYNEEILEWESLQKIRPSDTSDITSTKGGVLLAVRRLLEEIGSPMHYAGITQEIIDRGYWATNGKTPSATVNAQLSTNINQYGEESDFIRTGPGYYYLRDKMES